MLKSSLTKLMVVVLAIIIMVPIFGVSAQGNGTVVDVIVGSPDHALLATAVTLAGLTDTLSDESAEFTVFAPTDAGINGLSAPVLGYLLENPNGLLTEILTYHVVPGKVFSTDLSEGCTEVETLQGGSLHICSDGMGTITVNSANVTAADLEASNGVVHVINTVVLPSIDLPDIDPLDWDGQIITAGSSTVGPMTIAASNLWKDEGGVDVPTVDVIGSGAGFERFCINIESDISNASRPIKPSEIDECRSRGREPIEFRVGTDGLAVVVSNDFVDSLTMEQLAQVFTGQVKTWNEINPAWPAIDIKLFSPGTDSGTFDYFVEVVLSNDETGILDANPELSESDDFLVEGVVGSEGGIAYFGYAYYAENTDVLRVVAINGVTPTTATVETGEYPLARPLFIYSSADIMQAKPQVAAFIAFYLNSVIDFNAQVGYFPPSSDGLNLAKLRWLVATAGMSLE